MKNCPIFSLFPGSSCSGSCLLSVFRPGSALAVVGSRSVPDSVSVPVLNVLFSVFRPGLVVSGGARGVDSAAASVARSCGLPVRVFPFSAGGSGRFAGLARNGMIVAASSALFSLFVGSSVSGGAAHSASLALAAGLPVCRLLVPPPSQGLLF